MESVDFSSVVQKNSAVHRLNHQQCECVRTYSCMYHLHAKPTTVFCWANLGCGKYSKDRNLQLCVSELILI